VRKLRSMQSVELYVAWKSAMTIRPGTAYSRYASSTRAHQVESKSGCEPRRTGSEAKRRPTQGGLNGSQAIKMAKRDPAVRAFN